MKKLEGSDVTVLIVAFMLVSLGVLFIWCAVGSMPNYGSDDIQDCRMEEGKLILDFKNGNRIVTDQFTITIHQ